MVDTISDTAETAWNGVKDGWKATHDGLAQKIAKSVTKSYPFVKVYGIVSLREEKYVLEH